MSRCVAWTLCMMGLAWLDTAPAAAGEEPGGSHYHARLLVYRDAQGDERPVRSRDDWALRRRQILEGMQQAMGPLPTGFDRQPLDVQVHASGEQEGVRRLSISYNAALGSDQADRVTAYLYLPEPDGQPRRRAAILALHPTGAAGKDIVAGNGPRPNRGYALELAQRGYVVIAPDYPSFGELRDYDFAADAYTSGTMKGIVNHIRAVDVLAAREEVDPERIGVIGHSLGGHNALFVAAMDERLQAVVSSCGWCPLHDYYGGKLDGWTSPRYMPLIREQFGLDPDRVPFDFYEVVAAVAPRPFFSYSPLGDTNFDYRGVRKAIPRAREVYDLFGAGQHLQVRYADGGHDFPPSARREAYAFFDQHLKHKPAAEVPAWSAGRRTKVTIPSTLDGTMQASYLIVPEGYDAAGPAVPLLVHLHSWSGNVEQRNRALEEEANQRGWLMISPDFRGANDRGEACGSRLAQQDILDAVEWACANWRVDRQRIYLTGSSGGGHMTMLMAGRHPTVWAGASAWVGISDLAAWHRRHADDRYGQMMRAVCGGAPGESEEVDRQYRQRSPLTWLAAAVDVPLDLAAGVHDGHHGSVPVRHTLEAFNVVARAQGAREVSEQEMVEISRANGRLVSPQPEDLIVDPDFDREIYLRRIAGKARVTVFDGGHEGLARAACQWLSRQVRQP